MPKTKTKYTLEDLIKDYERKNIRISEAVMARIVELINQAYTDVAYFSARARLVNNRTLPKYVQEKIGTILDTLTGRIGLEIKKGAIKSWALSEQKIDLVEKSAFGGDKPPIKPISVSDNMESNFGRIRKAYGTGSEAAARQFIKKDLNLSSRVWKKSARKFIKETITEGLKTGRSARELSKDLREAALTNRKGAMKSSGPGVYKDPKKNAYRTARNEINKAYLANDYRQMQGKWWIIGKEVKTSISHPKYDMCDNLAGKYPKEFNFTKWHVNCYDDQTEVYTKSGWRYFKDVEIGEMILSLNTETKNLEYVKCIETHANNYIGNMVHFKNAFFDMVVTPGHPMFVISPHSKKFISHRRADEMTKGKGHFYRSSEYSAPDQRNMVIGNHIIGFDLFCQFMGYYLTDGAVIQSRTAWGIAAMKGNDELNRAEIKECLDKIGVKYTIRNDGFHSHDNDFYYYLSQFGKSPDKFVPEEIMNSSPRQIEIFLNAFISCDGSIRKPNPFVGNRGGSFIPKRPDRWMFTSSKIMAGQLGELLLKIGKRPSFSIDKTKGKRQEFNNGVYTINNDLIKIHECHSKTTTVYDKELIPYDGMVYDLTLEKNNTLYVRRNGKCTWGSNCICYEVPILCSIAEREAMSDFNLGISEKKPKIKYITKIPKTAQAWIKANKKRMEGWKTTPDWLTENGKYF